MPAEFLGGDLDIWIARMEGVEGDEPLHTREGRAEAVVEAEPETQMTHLCAANVEAVRVRKLLWIPVRGCQR